MARSVAADERSRASVRLDLRDTENDILAHEPLAEQIASDFERVTLEEALRVRNLARRSSLARGRSHARGCSHDSRDTFEL
jgi:hypothetical protein